MKRKILAIDPGTRDSAFVLCKNQVIAKKGIFPNISLDSPDIFDEIMTNDYECLVIEMVASYGMPVGKDVFETVLFIGRFIELARQIGSEVYLVYRKDIKMTLCNSTRAKDSNIRQALIDIYGPKGTKKDPNPFYNDSIIKMSKDIWSALAVAHHFDSGGDVHLVKY